MLTLERARISQIIRFVISFITSWKFAPLTPAKMNLIPIKIIIEIDIAIVILSNRLVIRTIRGSFCVALIHSVRLTFILVHSLKTSFPTAVLLFPRFIIWSYCFDGWITFSKISEAAVYWTHKPIKPKSQIPKTTKRRKLTIEERKKTKQEVIYFRSD